MYPFGDRRQSVTVDYLRASCFFDLVGTPLDGTERRAYPTIDRRARGEHGIRNTAEDIARIRRGDPGGIKTAGDLMEAECFGTNRRIVLHERS